jgi:hypothetical protein
MSDDAINRIEAIIRESEAQSHWFPVGADTFPELAKAKSEREEFSIAFAGHVFISHSSFDSRFIERFILPSVLDAAGKHYFMLNTSSYSSVRRGDFQHAMWVSGSLEGCKTVIVVVSANSRRSDWVKWEYHAAQMQRHPTIICSIDATGLGEFNGLATTAPLQIINFHLNPTKSSRYLSQILKLPAYSVGPWKGHPLGTYNAAELLLTKS